MRDVTDQAAAHRAALMTALKGLSIGIQILICGLPVHRTGQHTWDLWAPGACGCGAPSQRALALDQAAAQLHAWRPETAPRLRATTEEAA